MKKVALLLMLGALMILAFPQNNTTLEYTVTRLTDNEYRDYQPQINDNNDVVWQGYDGNDYEIYMYEWLIDWVWQITDNSYDDVNPKINNNGDIAWQGRDGSEYQISFYENDTDTIWEISSSDPGSHYNAMEPDLNNAGDIVWEEYDGSVYNILLYKNSTGDIFQLTTDIAVNNYNPRINDNGDVTWFRHYSDSIITFSDYYYVMVYDDSTNSSFNVWLQNISFIEDLSDIDDIEPKINDNTQIVWSAYDSSLIADEIYYYDVPASEFIQITDNDYSDLFPDINLEGDVTWLGFDFDADWEEILLYRNDTGDIEQITNTAEEPYWAPTMPQISDVGYVAFLATEARLVGWNLEVYVYDGSQILNISVSEDNESFPRINSIGSVVWAVDTDAEDDEIFLATLPEEEEEEENGNGDGSSLDCFIATACYGTRMADEVKILRRFRDRYLIKHPAGRAFVHFYNKYGPKAADFIRNKEPLKRIIRHCLKPIILFMRVSS
jgi:hypothetical protein